MNYQVDEIRNALESHGYDVFLHGQDVAILCPFCPEDDPDTKGKNYITPAKGIYHCFRCNEAGSIRWLFKKLGIQIGNQRISLEKIKEQVSRMRTLKKFGGNSLPKKMMPVGLPDEFEPLRRDRNFGLAKIAYRWLHRRGLDWKIIKDWRIGFCSTGAYAQRIILPFCDMFGNVVTFQAREFLGSSGTKSKNPAVEESTVSRADVFFGMHRMASGNSVVLVEGPFDVIAVDGFLSATKLVNFTALGICGTEVSDIQFRILESLEPREIFVMLDADAPEKARRLGGELLRYCPRVRVAELVRGDPDDLSRKEFVKIISRAYTPLPLPLPNCRCMPF